MTRTLSMFSATADLEGAFAELAAAALGTPRTVRRLSIEEARDVLASAQGIAAMRCLAENLGIPGGAVPDAEQLMRLFDDDLLSKRALAMHRGRNVYSSGKLALWNALWMPFANMLEPDTSVVELATELVSMRTHERGPDVARCVTLLVERLVASGFEVEQVGEGDHAPLLIARRPARGLVGRIVMYGHYDAVAADAADWATDPWTLTERDQRLYGCGIGDNKGALAARLLAMERITCTPELVWVLQGEEEHGSPLAHGVLPSILAPLRADLWLEETGYHELDGTQRILARTIGEDRTSRAPDHILERLMVAIARDASAWGCASRVEARGLNKDFFPRGCPFNANLPVGARYLALGINDPASGIHRPNESVPSWTFALHARQLETVFREVGRIAGATS